MTNFFQWIPENKHVQRFYISTILSTLEDLVDFWSEDESSETNKALLFPTRRTEDIGRLVSSTVINLEGLVTRVRAIQVSHNNESLFTYRRVQSVFQL